MSLFNFGKKKAARQQESTPTSAKTPEPAKEPKPPTKKPASKWSDPEYLRNLDAALKRNPGKSAMQVITDTERELVEKRQSSKTEHSSTTENQPAVQFGVKITSRWVEREPFGEITRMEFPPLCNGRGKFLNYRQYFVWGVDSSGKKQLVKCKCQNEQQAEEIAVQEGCVGPFDIRLINPEPPTERQLAYVKDLGVILSPDDMEALTKTDISYIIDRATGEDSKESPSPELIDMAKKLNWKGSAYIGHDNLWYSIVKSADDRTLAALYIYAIRQYQKHKKIGNMFTDPDLALFYQFADYAIAEPSALKSIKGRDPSDFMEPSKGTIAYKAVIDFLKSINK